MNYSTETELSQFGRHLNEKNVLGNDQFQSESAFVAASARDGALIDLKNLNNHISSRRLLSDMDYVDGENSVVARIETNEKSQKESKSKRLSGDRKANNGEDKMAPSLEKKHGYNLTKKSNESMELVLINGTWHLIDLNICYNMMRGEAGNTNEYYHNNTHINK